MLTDAREPAAIEPTANFISALIERLESTHEGNRELDCQLAYVIGYGIEGMGVSFRGYCHLHGLNWSDIAREANAYQSILSHALPRFTTSSDTMLAQIGKLPDWRVMAMGEGPDMHPRPADFAYDGSWFVRLHSPSLRKLQFASAPFLPMALCIAYLRAFQTSAGAE